ncbi:MAG: oxygen-independent coproporphyrinogen III oxidase [Pseudomonadota bacterium]
MTDRVRQYSTRPVPRYTSYPTVPHFGDGVTVETYARWLARLDPSQTLSLYLHVPYCKQACWYCGCNMKLAARPEPVADYAATLMQETSLLAQHLPARFTISHLHWGGGTPTAMTADDLECAMEVVRANFDIAPNAELAIESDPRTVDDEMIARIGAMGFNRASFGVQEFDPQVQVAINRVQPPEMVAEAVDKLRRAGVSSINFDLIYGLPYQTADILLRTIDVCAAMAPDRIALFGYAHVPWMAKRQRMIPEAALPGAAERLEQADQAATALVDHGYVPVGLDHFALPGDCLARAERAGTLKRNFQGYTTDTAAALLGVGATAIGRTPDGLVQNIAETGAWARAVSAGVLPVSKGHAYGGEDKLRADVIEALMCFGVADIAAISSAHGVAPEWADGARAALRDVEGDGLVSWTGHRLTVAKDGLPLVRVVASAFDIYFQGQAAKHSIAV